MQLRLLAAILAAILACANPLPASPAVYNAQAPIQIGIGQQATVWNAETPTPGSGTTSASQQVAPTAYGRGTPLGIDGKFSGAPGTFEVDVQVAGTDSDTSYQTCYKCSITIVDSTNNTFHMDYSGTARYVRLLMRTRANSVSITATVTGG